MNKEYINYCFSMKIDRIRVYLKCLVGEKTTFKAIRKLITTTIGYVSSFFAFAVLLKDLVNIDKLELLCKRYWWILILISTVFSLIHHHSKIFCKGILGSNIMSP